MSAGGGSPRQAQRFVIVFMVFIWPKLSTFIVKTRQLTDI